jgi:uncharacterized protein
VPADSQVTARRFILGRQGLWPGRRWSGRRAVDKPIRYLTEIQVDPLNVIGHSQDLVLWGRIDGYRSDQLEDALYKRRSVFEWGGALAIRSIEELPYLKLVMQRIVAEKRWRKFAKTHADTIARVAREIERRGPLGGRDFEGKSITNPGSFRGGKEATQALYYLWLKGEVMVAYRRSGGKVYDLTSRLFPAPSKEIPTQEAEERLILQTLRDLGLATAPEWLAYAHGRIRRSTLRYEWKERMRKWTDQGAIQEVEISGWSGRRWFVAEANSEMETLRNGEVPKAWRPVSTTTGEEAVFLSPFEQTTARGRSQRLFDFELLCEFYKPASRRRWGYYTLPILLGDALIARIDMRFEAPTKCIRVLGFWPENLNLRKDEGFADALGKGLARLAQFHAAVGVDLSAAHIPKIEAAVRESFQAALGSDSFAS